MHRRAFILQLAAVAALAACAPLPRGSALSRAQAAALRISKVEVAVQGASFENDGAEGVRNLISGDLSRVIRDEFADRLSASGAVLQVDLSVVNVSTSTNTALGRDQSRLVGQVSVVEPSGRVLARAPIEVTAGTAAETALGSAAKALTGRRGRYYRQMLTQFARDTRTVLLGRDLPGERLIRKATTG